LVLAELWLDSYDESQNSYVDTIHMMRQDSAESTLNCSIAFAILHEPKLAGFLPTYLSLSTTRYHVPADTLNISAPQPTTVSTFMLGPINALITLTACKRPEQL